MNKVEETQSASGPDENQKTQHPLGDEHAYSKDAPARFDPFENLDKLYEGPVGHPLGEKVYDFPSRSPTNSNS